MFFELALLGCILQIVQAACEEQTADQQTTKCKPKKCDVTIGGSQYCSQCSKNDDHLIDGKCVTTGTSGAADKCTANNAGACTSCGAGYFLHKGGCYATAEDKPGHALCTATGKGVCTTAAAGYFAIPNAPNTGESGVKCDDIAGVEVSTNTYKGVDKCATCTAPSSVTVREAKTAICKSCIEGYYVDSDGSVCTQCTDTTNCAICLATGANKGKCTECKSSSSNNYLKITDTETQSGDCVAQSACTGTHFPVAADKKCYLCSNTDKGGIANCQECSKSGEAVTCSACTQNKKPNKEGTGCFACSVDGCSNCNKDGVCEACGNSKKVSPGGSSCVTACPENSTEKENACICSSGFTPSGDSCVASSSVNLSTGAIAGISVAAVVVVGGLVGFLCWWFVCRGKA